ncbi:GIY-YIG nuclease family protein [Salisaeta longa]|uniref:GIY-YIG nuclease family protein n=1 Tax=Salisaeta longa TaxID=503170 RepID=UPI001B7FAC10|nr:GIY-YIG nuclease family protein [Salisaeta longa]
MEIAASFPSVIPRDDTLIFAFSMCCACSCAISPDKPFEPSTSDLNFNHSCHCERPAGAPQSPQWGKNVPYDAKEFFLKEKSSHRASTETRQSSAMARRTYYVYILTNAHHTVLYTGMTNDLRRRVAEHRQGEGSAFVRRYNATKLVYAEAYSEVRDAIRREKQLKAGTRAQKVACIQRQNPSWRDLSADL